MSSLKSLMASAVAAVALAACVTAPSPSEYRAPQPAKPVDVQRLWSGRWHEIARLPDRLTDGCVAGASIYTPVEGTRIDVRDTCQVGTPQGRKRPSAAGAKSWTPARTRNSGSDIWPGS